MWWQMMAAENDDSDDDFAQYRGPIQPYMFEPIADKPPVQIVDAVQSLPPPVTDWWVY